MKHITKTLSISALCALSGVSYATDRVLVGGDTVTGEASSIESLYKYSDTTVKKPWTSGVMANVSGDRIVWGGHATINSSRTKGEGFILVDGSFIAGSLITSGTGGNGSTLNMFFDDATATGGKSQLTLGAITWNGDVYANKFIFKGLKDNSTGTIKLTTAAQTFSFKSSTTATEEKRYIEFGKGIEVLMNNQGQTLELTGRNTDETNMLVNGTLRVSNNNDGLSLNLKDGAKMVVGSTGKLVVSGRVNLASSVATRSQASALTLNSSGNEINNVVYMAQATSLYVNAGNNLDSVIARGSDVLVEFTSGESYVKNFLVAEMSNTRALSLTVTEDALLKISSLTGSYKNDDDYQCSGFGENVLYADYQNLVLTEFGEGRILVEDITGAENFLKTLSVKGDADKELFFSAYDATAGGYWLTAIEIPEPAEWATILGALAFGLAIYRRRK